MQTFLTISLVFYGLYRPYGRGGQGRLSISPLSAYLNRKSLKRDYKVLDASVIIDGRIADVAETGFLGGTDHSSFILTELQQVDSADSSKRQQDVAVRHASASEQQQTRYSD